MTAPMLILPIEERNRELNSRVLIALRAVAAGYDVIIGQQWEVFARLPELAPSIILFKGNNAAQAEHMVVAKQAGHIVCSIEEEVLAVSDDREILRCYHPAAQPALDLIFAQGEHQRGLLREKWPASADRIVAVGNPRADLLKLAGKADPSDATKALRRRHGPFVLFNTNFASINPAIDDIYGYFELCVRVGVMDPESQEDMRFLHEQFLWERATFEALTTLAMQLAKDGVTVVIRPHPSENTELWQRQMAGITGLSVIQDGSQLDWLKASSLMVHSGCTTGLEAFLLGHPVITLIPGDHTLHGAFISNIVSTAFEDGQAARRAIHEHLDGTHGLEIDRQTADARLRGLLSLTDDQSAADRIVDALSARWPPDTSSRAVNPAEAFASARTHLSQRRAAKVAFTHDEIASSINECSQMMASPPDLQLTEIGPVVFHLSGTKDDG